MSKLFEPYEANQRVWVLTQEVRAKANHTRYAVDNGAPWTEIDDRLREVRQLLEALIAAHNDFERAVEHRYAAEIAAAEES